MAELIQKAAPIIVVAAVFGWCCWPYLVESAGGLATGESGIAGLPNSLLSPMVKSGGERDPFKSVDAAAALKNLLAQTQGVGDEASDQKGADGEVASTPNKTWETLVLNGTYVQGDRHMAIIDGKIYSTGEALDGVGTAKQPWIVKKVFPEKVLILCGADLRTLCYANLASTPVATDGQDKPESGGEEAADNLNKQPHAAKGASQGSSDGTTSTDVIRMLQEALGQKQ